VGTELKKLNVEQMKKDIAEKFDQALGPNSPVRSEEERRAITER
jgi:hypothetical protein